MNTEQVRPMIEIVSSQAPTFVVYIGESPTGGYTANLWQKKPGHPIVGPPALARILGIKTTTKARTRAKADRNAAALLHRAALAVAKGR